MTREKLQAELVKLVDRERRRDDQARIDRQRRHAIETELRRMDMLRLVGVANAVTLRFRGYDRRIPDDSVGTITKVARKRVNVDFGEHGTWTIPVTDLIAVGEDRGFTLRLGGAG